MLNHAEHFSKIKEIYNLFEDTLSQEIFKSRVMWSATGENKYIEQLIELTPPSINHSFKELLKKASEAKRVVLYGATEIGEFALYVLRDCKDKITFCDRFYKTIKNVQDIPVISPDTILSEYSDAFVIICASAGYQEIYNSLIEHSFEPNHIFDIFNLDYSEIYFDEVIKLSEDEIFADVGAFDGLTTLEFIRKCNNKYKKIYLFEPEKPNFEKTSRELENKNIHSYELFNIGLWDRKKTIKFLSASFSSRISDDGNAEIFVDALDNILATKELSEYPTYIKMDIEGAELYALIGAKRIIQQATPKLAISIYHKPEDIVEILSYIREINPNYKFFLRHYTSWRADTVLYAIPIK